MKKILFAGTALFALAACSAGEKADDASNAASEAQTTTQQQAPDAVLQPEVITPQTDRSLDAILAAQPDDAKARYGARHPKETLEFFGIEPGMTVVEVLPGGGWYTKLLLPYLGENGKVVGADYSPEMWALFGGFADEAFLEGKKTWTRTWVETAQGWRNDGDAGLNAFAYGNLPDTMNGTADAVLMVRALHHFNRFEDQGGYLTSALSETMKVLKPGGIVGVVQHRGPEGNDDAWANGDQGYLKQSAVIAFMEAAGFELVSQSEINANPKDQPTNDDMVWRLPPTLGTSRDNEELKAQLTAIGETDRMTLLFRKPA